MPATPKHSSARARTNRASTNRHLSAVHDVKTPALPTKRPAWLKATRDWWRDIWSSPMAPEFDKSDLHGLFVLAYLMDDFFGAETASARKEAAAEIRLQRQCFGLTPIDRRRLQWEIDRGEEAVGKTQKRRSNSVPKPAAGSKSKALDPRSMLA